MESKEQTIAELGHDGLVHWQAFKEWATKRSWHLDQMSPNEIGEYYDLFTAGYERGERDTLAKVAETLREHIALYRTPRAQIASIEKNIIEKIQKQIDAEWIRRVDVLAPYRQPEQQEVKENNDNN